MDTQARNNILNILFVEDDPFVGDIYIRALQKAGHKTTLEGNGQTGFQIAQTGDYDIILLDLMLPGLSGTEILRMLRDPKQAPKLHAKIIILTNVEESKEGREALQKQADGYLVKASVTPLQLVDYLRQFSAPPPAA